MNKVKTISYWVFTLWASLGMVSTGIVQAMHHREEVEMFHRLGYPQYLLTMLATAKFAGTVVILLPGLVRLKEWVYAGFVYMMVGAVISHYAVHDNFVEVFPALLLLMVTVISWCLLPSNRRLVSDCK